MAKKRDSGIMAVSTIADYRQRLGEAVGRAEESRKALDEARDRFRRDVAHVRALERVLTSK